MYCSDGRFEGSRIFFCDPVGRKKRYGNLFFLDRRNGNENLVADFRNEQGTRGLVIRLTKGELHASVVSDERFESFSERLASQIRTDFL